MSNNDSPRYKLKKSEVVDKQLEEERLNFQRQQFAAIRSMQNDIAKSLKSTPSVLSRFDSKQVATYLQNPQKHEKLLRQLSNYLYNVNAQYRLLIRHMSTMPLYAYDLKLIGQVRNYAPDKVQKALYKTSEYIDKLNLAHEMSQALKIAFKEDVYFGYEHESKDSFFLQRLDPDYCQIGTAEEDGVLNFSYDFTYFDKYPIDLVNFPDEFRVKYQKYKANTKEYRWQELDSHKAVAFKINEELPYCLPPFNTLFESIFSADEYEKLQMSKAKMDNFLLLVQKIPLSDKNGVDMDSFLINPDLANLFHENTSASIGEGIGLTTTPMDIEAISLDKKQNQNNFAEESITKIFSNAGVAQQMFNSSKTSSVGISKSIIADEQLIFDVYKQIERWLNRKLKKMSGSIKFRVKFYEVTRYSKKEELAMLISAGQSTMPVIKEIAALIGKSPNDLYNDAVIENEILGLHDLLKPLASSHTQSGTDGGGRPNTPESERSDSTQVNIDNLDD